MWASRSGSSSSRSRTGSLRRSRSSTSFCSSASTRFSFLALATISGVSSASRRRKGESGASYRCAVGCVGPRRRRARRDPRGRSGGRCRHRVPTSATTDTGGADSARSRANRSTTTSSRSSSVSGLVPVSGRWSFGVELDIGVDDRRPRSDDVDRFDVVASSSTVVVAVDRVDWRLDLVVDRRRRRRPVVARSSSDSSWPRSRLGRSASSRRWTSTAPS